MSDFIQRCSVCGRERTLADVNDYNPLQAVMGAPLGWYSSAEDGEICPEDMEQMMRGTK